MQVLSQLPPIEDDRLLVGSSSFDDAGVARLDADRAVVQSVDFFPPVVDDPWWFGRIAAANALSDLYAMGAVPFSALNIVVFPKDALPLDVLATILEGGASAMTEAGALQLGGHTVVDEGVKYGLAVTGFVKPGEQLTNDGARVGDVIFLTKRLGTGCLTTAARKQKTGEEALAAACEQMGRLNRDAAEALEGLDIGAVTDVTGFGLAGHAAEVAAGSGADVRLFASALPLLDEARSLMDAGFASGGAARTREFLGDRFVAGAGVDETTVQLVADSETSGGLLVSVAPADADALAARFAERDVLVARVGEVVAGDGRVQLLAS